MSNTQFALMLLITGGIAVWTMREMMSDSLWFVVPLIAVLLSAGVLHFFYQRPDPAIKRRAQILAIGFIAFFSFRSLRYVRLWLHQRDAGRGCQLRCCQHLRSTYSRSICRLALVSFSSSLQAMIKC